MRLHAERLYVRCPNWVGDLVMATPILAAIRESFSQAKITLGLRPHLEPILRNLNFHDDLHFHPAKAGFRDIQKIAAELKRHQFDAAILFPNSFETALAVAMAGIPKRYGYAMNGRGFLLTNRLRPPTAGFRRIPTPMPYYWTDLVGLAGVEVRSIRPRLAVDDATILDFDRWLLQKGVTPADRLVMVAPGASFGSSKLWKPDRFAAVIDGLHEREKTKALLQFGPGEEPIAREIEKHCKTPVILAADPPLDLHRLKAAARRCDLLICTDSGVRHYGVAFDRPVICIMGPNDPRYTAANLEKTVVIREDVDCGPCQLKLCPLDHRCMERIDPRRVVAAASQLLLKFPRSILNPSIATPV